MAASLDHLAATLVGVEGSRARLRLADGATVDVELGPAQVRPGAPVTLSLRPGHLRVVDGVAAPGRCVLQGIVARAERVAGLALARVDVAGGSGTVTVAWPPGAALPAPGSAVLLEFDPVHASVAAGRRGPDGPYLVD